MSQVKADFSSSETDACGNLKVNFYDQSTVSSGGIIVSWEWDLGGGFSGKQNPGAIFTEPGSFTICLKVTDNSGNSDTHCKEEYINIFPDPIVDFSVDNTNGCSPVTVNLTDLSSSENGNITRWIWDIGGSANVLDTKEALTDISTTYDVPAVYSLSLTVFDEKGCSATEVKKDLITVNENTSPDIDFNIISSCGYPWEIQFLNLSPDPTFNYTWDFGNGQVFRGAFPPIISYDSAGIYDLTIVTENGQCTDTTVFNGYIDTDLDDEFSASSEAVCPGSIVQFKDNGQLFSDSLLWIFGDGNFSRDREPNHTFESPGCYPTQLIRYRTDCIDTIQGDCIWVSENPDINYSINNQFTCGVPIDIQLNGITSGKGNFEWKITGNDIDETISGQNVDFTIEEFGRYDVAITYTDVTGCTQVIDTIDLDIIPYSVRLPRFGPEGCIPLNANMTDSVSSPIPIKSWDWTVFNEDSILYTSSESAPSFAIGDTGKWDVRLVVENIYGCRDTVVRRDYIQGGIPPEVDFVATPLESCIIELKQFTDLSESIANSWFWEFGDSTTSFLQNPEKIYSTPGIYDVTLVAYHNGCGSREFKQEFIDILYPRSAYRIEYNCDDPYTVDLINATVGATELEWTIAKGPGDTITMSDSLIMPVTFPERGKFPVVIYSINDSTGCEHIYTDTILIADPLAAFELDTTAGCVPMRLPGYDMSIDAERFSWKAPGAFVQRDTFSDPTFNYNLPGVYPGPQLTVTSIHGCQDSIALMDSIMVNTVIASATFNEIICVPGFSDPISTSIDLLGNIIEYEWRINDTLLISNDTFPIFNIDQPGIYDLSLSVVDDWNCSDTEVYPMAIEAIELIPEFTADTLSCTWAPVRFRAKNTTANIDSFYWDFGDGNSSTSKNTNYTYGQEGIYTVCLTMIDKRRCEQTICKDNYVTIQDPVASFTGDPLVANCPPLLTNFNNQSANTVTHFWDFGDDTGNSTNLNPSHVYTEPGVFDVTLIVSMSPSCRDTMVREEYIRLEGPKGNFYQTADSTCLPLEVTLSADSDDLYTYIYDYGNGELDSLTSKVSQDERSYTYQQVGRYVPKVIIIDNKGCARAIAGDPIFVNTMDLDFEIQDTSFCNSPADVTITNLSESTSGNIQYEWLMYGPQSASSGEAVPTFKMDSLGLYDVRLIGRSENCIDTIIKENIVEISVDPDVQFSIINDQLCDEVQVQFQNESSVISGEIVSYFWDFGDGYTSTDENPAHIYTEIESFTATLTAETRNGCTSTYSMVIPVSPNTIGNVGLDDTICIGDQIQLQAQVDNLQDGGGFYWLDDPSLSCVDCLDPYISPSSTTMYTFVAFHPNGCESIDSVLITVIQKPGPTLQLEGDTIICIGDETVFTVTDYDTSFTYFWDDSNDILDCITNCETVTALPNDTSTFYVTVLNEYGCFKKDTLIVYVEFDIGNIVTEDKSICGNTITQLNVLSGNIQYWDPSDDLSCLNCPDPIASPSQTTYYYVNVISDEGCEYRDSVLIHTIPVESINAGDDQLICQGESVLLKASGVGNANWYDIDDPDHILSRSYNFSASPSDTTYYVISTSNDECILTDTVIVNVARDAEIIAIGDTICPGETATIHANPILTDVFWWEYEDGAKLENTFQIEVSPDSTTRYKLVGAFRSCQEDVTYAEVYVMESVEVELEDFYKVYANESVQINMSYDADKTYTFLWSPGEGLTCTDCPEPIIPDVISNMNLTVSIIDEKTGCMIEQDVEIRYFNECTPNVFTLPNVFTPDEDGNNDRFRIYTMNEDEFLRIHIFDRWGNKVFYSEDINHSWDGRFQGQHLVPGVYAYRVDAFCELNGEEYFFYGDVTLLR